MAQSCPQEACNVMEIFKVAIQMAVLVGLILVQRLQERSSSNLLVLGNQEVSAEKEAFGLRL